jgi:hypothetical protein
MLGYAGSGLCGSYSLVEKTEVCLNEAVVK